MEYIKEIIMNISTTVIINVRDNATRELISDTSGKAADVILPRIGEFIELKTSKTEDEPVAYKVTSIVHSFERAYRNTITIYVRSPE